MGGLVHMLTRFQQVQDFDEPPWSSICRLNSPSTINELGSAAQFLNNSNIFLVKEACRSTWRAVYNEDGYSCILVTDSHAQAFEGGAWWLLVYVDNSIENDRTLRCPLLSSWCWTFELFLWPCSRLELHLIYLHHFVSDDTFHMLQTHTIACFLSALLYIYYLTFLAQTIDVDKPHFQPWFTHRHTEQCHCLATHGCHYVRSKNTL